MAQPLLPIQGLVAFAAVAETLSFTKGARRLGIAQQLVSSRIARLEHQLGITLFERNTRHVQLSEPGRRLFIDARDVLERLEAAHRNVVLASNGKIGSLSIGCGDYAVETILPRLLRQFRDQHPQVSVTLYEQRTAAQLVALRNGEIDVGLALLPPQSDDLDAEVLSEEGFVVAIATPSKRKALQRVPLSYFRDAPFVATPRSRSPGLEDLMDRMFREAQFMPNIVQYAAQPLTLLALVAADVGVMLAPEAFSHIKRDGVTFVPIDTKHRVRLSMIMRKGAQQSQALINFVNLARSEKGASQSPRGSSDGV